MKSHPCFRTLPLTKWVAPRVARPQQDERTTRSARRRTPCAMNGSSEATIRTYLDVVTRNPAESMRPNQIAPLPSQQGLSVPAARRPGRQDNQAIEGAFVSVAKQYGYDHGIEYATWIEIGVDAAVLTRAGITRAKSTGNG